MKCVNQACFEESSERCWCILILDRIEYTRNAVAAVYRTSTENNFVISMIRMMQIQNTVSFN